MSSCCRADIWLSAESAQSAWSSSVRAARLLDGRMVRVRRSTLHQLAATLRLPARPLPRVRPTRLSRVVRPLLGERGGRRRRRDGTAQSVDSVRLASCVSACRYIALPLLNRSLHVAASTCPADLGQAAANARCLTDAVSSAISPLNAYDALASSSTESGAYSSGWRRAYAGPTST